MKIGVAVLGMLFASFALPARADTFDVVGGGGFGTQIVTNGVPTSFTLVELFSTSFVFNTQDDSVSDMSFSLQGPLPNDFSFVGVTHSGIENLFKWASPDATITGGCPDFVFAAVAAGVPPGNEECAGVQGTLFLSCLDATCANDFSLSTPGALISSIAGLDVAPTPEPASLVLFAIGLLAVGLVLRHRHNVHKNKSRA